MKCLRFNIAPYNAFHKLNVEANLPLSPHIMSFVTFKNIVSMHSRQVSRSDSKTM
jgi:hypothetical protein